MRVQQSDVGVSAQVAALHAAGDDLADLREAQVDDPLAIRAAELGPRRDVRRQPGERAVLLDDSGRRRDERQQLLARVAEGDKLARP